MVETNRDKLADLRGLSTELENLSPPKILEWAWATFGERLALSSSFQTQSLPLLHFVSTHVPELPVLFLDTGFHFPETLAFRDQLMEEWGLNVMNLRYADGHGAFQQRHGALYKTDPDMCCRLNKVEPLKEALEHYDAWITGVRRDQTENRADTPVISQRSDGVYKICPMVTWTSRDVFKYINRHDLPVHPLLSKGYMSVGCAPCTKSTFGGDERSGRWAGSGKTECGLHLDSPGGAGRGDTGQNAKGDGQQ
jgi:phosphoadenosine phosphosulfate reductase